MHVSICTQHWLQFMCAERLRLLISSRNSVGILKILHMFCTKGYFLWWTLPETASARQVQFVNKQSNMMIISVTTQHARSLVCKIRGTATHVVLLQRFYFVVNSLRPSDLYTSINIDSHSGLSSERRQAIIWTNAGILSLRPNDSVLML